MTTSSLTVCDADVKAMFMCVWNDAPAGSTDTSLNGMILRPDASIDCLLQINATRQLCWCWLLLFTDRWATKQGARTDSESLTEWMSVEGRWLVRYTSIVLYSLP